MSPAPRSDERGVALLTVLLLVAVMSTLAVAVLDDIRFAMRRSANAASGAQAQWYALGAEQLAKVQLGRILAQRPDRLSLEGGWEGRPLAYPVDGGTITARVGDRSHCFNLNSVVVGPDGEYIAEPGGVAQLAALIEASGADGSEALRLANALADWIDADLSANRFGAEDETYGRRSPAYRTGGALLAEESELRAVAGFTPQIYERLRPLVCALPQAGPTVVNINTLAPTDAPVLSALWTGRLAVDDARMAIESRPEGGWASTAAFFDLAPIKRAAAGGGEPPTAQIALTSRWFGLESQVRYGDAEVQLSALFEATPTGQLRTVARRWSQPD